MPLWQAKSQIWPESEAVLSNFTIENRVKYYGK